MVAIAPPRLVIHPSDRKAAMQMVPAKRNLPFDIVALNET
jgi:hypothetical protein